MSTRGLPLEDWRLSMFWQVPRLMPGVGCATAEIRLLRVGFEYLHRSLLLNEIIRELDGKEIQHRGGSKVVNMGRIPKIGIGGNVLPESDNRHFSLPHHSQRRGIMT
jgi:hypothetical protein